MRLPIVSLIPALVVSACTCWAADGNRLTYLDGNDPYYPGLHFPKLTTPAVFVHGSRDPFGTLEELRAAIALIPARTEIAAIEGAGHDLKRAGVAQVAMQHFRDLMFPRYNADNPA